MERRSEKSGCGGFDGRLRRRFGSTRRFALLVVEFAFKPGLFTRKISQIIEFCAADLAAADDFDLVDHRGMDRKDPLHADAVGDLAHGETGFDGVSFAADDDALVDLDAFLVAFLDLGVDANRISHLEIGNLLQTFALDLLNRIHVHPTFGKKSVILYRVVFQKTRLFLPFSILTLPPPSSS